ncbi:kelch repeat-containing protein [Roseimicrobium sp. ORNL1]|uniref:Kelch repeat-containing protein n=1 Tax=Roseimicrobium sp. ORNL1 TaxID=2711231 RepID=UPI0013E1007C|nr:kelch repeat-containing protein [Roseimicrobium sp. ORNL1]QIF04050.1 hypothetical protein G5S37_21800 [Roseimicrobium sp. ORNL1]
MISRFVLGTVPLAALALLATASITTAETPPPSLPPLPEAVTSFGGAISEDGQLFAYGGHKAGTHEWSLDTTSGKLNRLDLTKPGSAWETLGEGPKVQSPGLAVHAGKVYLVGGMQPQNKEGAKPELFSLNHATMFDPATKDWKKLPDLPEGRSSHEVAVLDGKLYVVGGWPLDTRKSETKPDDAEVERGYHKTMLVLDLAKPDAWQSVPQPFQRRALSVVASQGKIYALGGMNEKNEVTADADVYDVKSGKWEKLPEIPVVSKKTKAFATAACELDGRVLVSPAGGKIFALSPDAKSWVEVGQLQTPRLFHQIEPWKNSQVVALGGTKGTKPTDSVEIVSIAPPATVSAK